MSLLTDLQASVRLTKTIKQQRALIGALREEVELLKAQLAFSNARLLKESGRKKAEVIDLAAIRQSI